MERRHRTHRHEGPFGYDPGSCGVAARATSRFARLTNYDRLRSALRQL